MRNRAVIVFSVLSPLSQLKSTDTYRRLMVLLDEYEWLVIGVGFIAAVLSAVLYVTRHLP
ncbi:MAG: hypothetical protein Q7S54_00105 [bacterium]|nr:hypothetical protein [bacterium]